MNDDNNNVPIESGNPNRQTLIILMSGILLLGICALGVLGYLWLKPGQDSPLSKILPTVMATHAPASVPTSTPVELQVPTVGMPDATQQPLEQAKEPPAFASAADAKSGYDAGDEILEGYALNSPSLPDINQPGDVYTYNIDLQSSIPLIWLYGWCTTTHTILDDNFKHINIKFVADDVNVSDTYIAVSASQNADGSPCEDHLILVNQWTTGQHHLETRVTFTQDINDGWNLYPAGTHTYEYIVNVYP